MRWNQIEFRNESSKSRCLCLGDSEWPRVELAIMRWNWLEFRKESSKSRCQCLGDSEWPRVELAIMNAKESARVQKREFEVSLSMSQRLNRQESPNELAMV